MPPELTADNAAASVDTGSTPASTASITSGTASEAMIKAATAASSAEAPPTGDKKVGDTPPPASTTDAGASVAAIEPPVKDDSAAAAAATRGEAPPHRIEAAVRNARQLAQAETLRSYGLEGVDPADVRVGMEILADIRKDPKSFWQRLGTELGAQGGGKTTEEVEEDYPEADLISPDGKLKTYSIDAHRKALDIHGRKIQKQLMGELRPVMDFVENEKSTRSTAEAQAAVQTLVGQTLTEARKLPHFTKENEPLIVEKMKAIAPEVKRAIGPVAALYMAYNQMMAEKVFPGIDAAAEAKVRDSYAKKANASNGSTHPVSTGGDGKPVKLDNQQDLARHMERMAAAVTAS